jgi:hypothetical protein
MGMSISRMGGAILAAASLAVFGRSGLSMAGSEIQRQADDMAATDLRPDTRRRGKGRGYQGRNWDKGNSIAGGIHAHRRERARRTTRPGTPERRAAYAALRPV